MAVQPRKAYETPQLTVLGRLSELTESKRGSLADRRHKGKRRHHPEDDD